jgi:hypothetical protein
MRSYYTVCKAKQSEGRQSLRIAVIVSCELQFIYNWYATVAAYWLIKSIVNINSKLDSSVVY